MLELESVLQGIVEQGLIFALVVMGVYLTSRIIKFDDLSVEGSFGVGGAFTAQALLIGCDPWLTLPCVFIAGGLVGLATGLLHTQLRMNNLISGIVVTTAVFSINLKLSGANISLGHTPTLFSALDPLFGQYKNIVLLLPLTLLAFGGIRWFLKTEVGFLLRAVGCNPQMLTSLGKRVDFYKIMGLVISNALTALAGALFVQWTGFFSITGNIGTLIIALAGLMLGEIFSRGFGIGLIFGAIIYQLIFAVTIEFQVDPVWNNLIKALLIIVLIQLKRSRKTQVLWR